MYKCKDYGTTKVTDIFDGNGKPFRTKYDLKRTFSLTILDTTFKQINRAVAATMKNKISKPNNDSILSNYMNVPKQCLKDIGNIKRSEVYSYCCVTSYSIQVTKISELPLLENFD